MSPAPLCQARVQLGCLFPEDDGGSASLRIISQSCVMVQSLRTRCGRGFNIGWSATQPTKTTNMCIGHKEAPTHTQTCIKLKDLTVGRHLDFFIGITGLNSNVHLGGQLVRLYSLCGSLSKANRAFRKFVNPNVHLWTEIILAYAKHGQGEQAIKLYGEMQQTTTKPDKYTYIAILKACTSSKALVQGRSIHSHIIDTGFESNMFVGSALVDMYAKCGSLVEARQVFDRMPKRDVACWNSMMLGYTRHGLGRQALQLFLKMPQDDIEPSHITFISILKACGSITAIKEGKLIHEAIIRTGLDSDVILGTCLIDMYAKCGEMDMAQHVFDRLLRRDVVSWNALIRGYVDNGLGHSAVQLFQKMQDSGRQPDSTTFASIIKAIAKMGSIEQGKLIHAIVVKSGLESDAIVGNALVDMYAKCRKIEEAQLLFDKLLRRDVVSWNALIAGYVQLGLGQKALQLFAKMQEDGLRPDKGTFISSLKACGSIGAVDQGELIHARVKEVGLEADTIVGTALVDMYAKCSNMNKARVVFDKIMQRDVISWNALIGGSIQNGLAEHGLQYFEEMRKEGIKPDRVTFMSVLKGCGSIAAKDEGKLVHSLIIKDGFHKDVHIVNCLIDMYAKLGNIGKALHVFDQLVGRDVVSWNVMISGFIQHGFDQQVLQLFRRMQQEGQTPDGITFVSVLKACGSLRNLDIGKLIHAQIIDAGLEPNVFVGNALIDMYSKCRSLDEARQVFNALALKDLVSWNSMIAGYAQHGFCKDALELFKLMQSSGVKADTATFVSILKACGNIAAIDQGRKIHAQICETGLDLDLVVGSTLVDMYGKCGDLEKAHQVFDNLNRRDVVLFNALISGYSKHGFGQQAVDVFKLMLQEGMKPTDVTFVAVLSACSHANLLDDGFRFYNSMSCNFGITPKMQHYACMVDLLGRTGNLLEAEDFLKNMPVKPDDVVWMSLLAACRMHGNVHLGRLAFESIVKLNPSSEAAYIQMSNIYAEANRWEDVAEVRKKMMEAGVKKTAGCTWMESRS
ncbi:hypothetical protein O6H91_13G076700 [Diphasiastrum complanatum]|uniref:Uncharacterized protein n=1 Tax=Diphasiastrum complanatum TaxID=34168 RepID=A0ACC2BWB3_DIPCM|nr:hypothetical protein O6H91_13G076700 [Diphasiastrum complanatum]